MRRQTCEYLLSFLRQTSSSDLYLSLVGRKNWLHEEHLQLGVRLEGLRKHIFEIAFIFLRLNMIFALKKETVVYSDKYA